MTPRRLLLVDDSDSVRLTLGAILEDAAYTVVEASSLQSARERLAAEPFDLVISDQNLGDGLGTQLAEVARQLQPRVAFILLTGAEISASGGVDLVVSKGLSPDVLLSALARLVSARPSSSASG